MHHGVRWWISATRRNSMDADNQTIASQRAKQRLSSRTRSSRRSRSTACAASTEPPPMPTWTSTSRGIFIPQVSVRPEPFGALLYHFGTRKLSFLKDRTLLTVVQSLASAPPHATRAPRRASPNPIFRATSGPSRHSRTRRWSSNGPHDAPGVATPTASRLHRFRHRPRPAASSTCSSTDWTPRSASPGSSPTPATCRACTACPVPAGATRAS